MARQIWVSHYSLHEILYKDTHLFISAKLVIQGRLIIATDLGSFSIGPRTKRLLHLVMRQSEMAAIHKDILRSCKHILFSLLILIRHNYLDGCKRFMILLRIRPSWELLFLFAVQLPSWFLRRLVKTTKSTSSKSCREGASSHLLWRQTVVTAAAGRDNLHLCMDLCCTFDRCWVRHLDHQGWYWLHLFLRANFRLAWERFKGPRIPPPLWLIYIRIVLKDRLVISWLLLNDRIRILPNHMLLCNICFLLLCQLFTEIEIAATLIFHNFVHCFIWLLLFKIIWNWRL